MLPAPQLRSFATVLDGGVVRSGFAERESQDDGRGSYILQMGRMVKAKYM